METNYSKLRRDFYESYQSLIIPEVKKYECSRIKKLIFFLFTGGIACCIGLYFFLVLFTIMDQQQLTDFLKISFVAAIVLGIAYLLKKII